MKAVYKPTAYAQLTTLIVAANKAARTIDFVLITPTERKELEKYAFPRMPRYVSPSERATYRTIVLTDGRLTYDAVCTEDFMLQGVCLVEVPPAIINWRIVDA